MKRVVWFALFLVIGSSCLDQPDCFRQDLNLVGISFKKMLDGKADTVALYDVSTALTDKTISFYNRKYLTGISLPLDYLNNSTTFAIEKIVHDFLTDISQHDTITFGHNTKVQFVSSDCGERFLVSNLELLKATYDSIQMVSVSASNPAHVNLIVYRCPRTNILRMGFRQLYMDDADSSLSVGRADSRPLELVSNSGTPWLSDTTLSAILLPLDPNATSTTYDINFKNGDSKTITFNYQIDAKTILTKCGPQQVYSKLTATSTFGIYKVTKDSLQDPPTTNIQTFRCPVTDEIKVAFKQVKGSSRITDTLHIQSLITDFPTDPNPYVDSATSIVTLKLNPNAAATTYTFNVANETTSALTLQVKYKAVSHVFHKACPGQTLFTELTYDEVNTSFYTSDKKVTVDAVKFPAVTNIEITRK